MPWRVGRDFRHLSQAAHHVLKRIRSPPYPLCLYVNALHSTRPSPWPPAVAFKHKHSHAPVPKDAHPSPGTTLGEDVAEQSLDSLLRRDRSKGGTGGYKVVPLAPPPEIMSILDMLHIHYPSRCPTSLPRWPQAAHLMPYLRQHAPGLVLHLLESNGADFALWTFSLATDMGYTFSPKYYGILAERLGKQGRWRDVIRLVRAARRDLRYTTNGLLNWELQALMELPRVVPVEEALAMFDRERVRPSRTTYHLLVTMHLRNQDLPSALSAVKAMESAGFPVRDRTIAIILVGYRSLGLTPDIKAQALSALSTADNDRVASVVLNGLVQLMLDVDDVAGVMEILSSVSHRLEDRVLGHGAGSIQDDDDVRVPPQEATACLPPCRGRDIVNLVTYNILLEYFARRGDLEGAVRVLQRLYAANVYPDTRTAAALVRLYFTAGQANDALHVVASTLTDIPDITSSLSHLGYTTSIQPEYPIPPPTKPSVYVFNALLRGVLQERGLSVFRAVLALMRRAGVGVDATTLTVLLSQMQSERKSSREMIRMVRVLMSYGVTPAMEHLHILLNSIARREREVARPRGWHVTRTIPTASPPSGTAETDRRNPPWPAADIGFLYNHKHSNLLRPILQSFNDRGAQGNRVTYAIRIKHEAVVRQDMPAANETFSTMVETGIQPNIYHYGALMEGYAGTGDVEAAADVMRMAADAGIPPDAQTHTILIAGYALLARPGKAVAAFRAMVAAGIRPDVPAIDALVSAFFRARAYAVARRVLLRLWTHAAPLPEEMFAKPLRELAEAFRALHGKNREAKATRLTSVEQAELRRTIRYIARGWHDRVLKGGTKRVEGRRVSLRVASSRQNPRYAKAVRG